MSTSQFGSKLSLQDEPYQGQQYEKSQAIDIGEDNNGRDDLEVPTDKGLEIPFKLNKFEKHVFTIVYSMVKENEVPYLVAIILMILEDLQLMSYSWREEFVGTSVVRYVFNPFLAFVETSTLASHIVSWAILLTLLGSMLYCGISLSAGQLRYMAPLHILRFLTLIVSTILYIPMFETFVLPLICVNSSPYGYPNFRCNGSEHLAVLSTGIIGAVLLAVFGLFMSLLYFSWSVNDQGGKRHGRTDVFYVLIRMALVLMEKRLDALTGSAITTALLGLLTAYFIMEQPFYNPVLNNLRSGLFGASFMLSVYALIFAASKGQAPVAVEIGVGVAVIVLAAVGIFFANNAFVQWQCNRIYEKLKKYDLMTKDNSLSKHPSANRLKEIRQSYLELVYDKTQEVVKRRAVSEKIQVFPGSQWVEISARFLRTAYLDQEAITLANRLMEVGILQYAKTGSVHLSYLNYITAFLPFLKGKESEHMTMMLRKCSMQFDERFLVYLQQQSIRQLDQMGRIAGDDSDLQFTSYIEYQSLENAVKQHHVETLVQLRDFWQAIRSDANAFTLSARLDRISESSSKTAELYKKLINRFPNSRNILLLNSRFHAMVTADQEQVQLFKNMADDLEANEVIEDDMRLPGEAELERKSAHSRGSSEASKESRMIKQKRNLLMNRLKTPMNEFMSRITLSCIVIIAFLIASIAFSKVAVDNTGTALDELDVAMISRRILPKIYNDVRRMTYSAEIGDAVAFSTYLNATYRDDIAWVYQAEPTYKDQVTDPNRKTIVFWNENKAEYSTEKLNIYAAAEHMNKALAYILNYGNINETALMIKYSNRSYTSNNQYFRYVFDNLDDMEMLLNENCLDVVEKFVNEVSIHIIVTSILYGILAILLVSCGFIIPRYYISICLKGQDDVINLFRKVPRSAILKFVTDLEEEIEIIQGTDDHTGLSGKGTANELSKNNITSRPILKWNYLLLLFLLLGCIPGMYVAVLNHLSTTQYVPMLFNNVNKRDVDLPLQIYGSMQSIVVKDDFTYSSRTKLAKTMEKVQDLKDLKESLFQQFEPLLKDKSSKLFKVLRSGDCWYGAKEVCAKKAVPQVGYTTDLIMSGVDSKIIRFVGEVDSWITEGEYYNINNNHLRLVELMTESFLGETLSLIRESILGIVSASISFTTIIIFVLLGAAIGLGIATYYIGFFTTAQSFYWNNTQLVGLLYFIPVADRVKITDLNTFIESGGAILNST